MLGSMRPSWRISEERPGIICGGLLRSGGRCNKSLNTRNGLWVHKFPERRWTNAGYHIPQIVLPQHCENNTAWQTLLNYRAGAENTTPAKFYNEICGCSYDSGSRLITLTDLKEACTLPTETSKIQEAAKYVNERAANGIYIDVVLGIDWGGGGADEISFTTVAVACLRYDGIIEIPFGYRSLTPHAHEEEVGTIMALRKMFQASRVVHDNCGSGPARETQLRMNGVPDEAFIRMNYVRIGNGSIMRFKPGDMREGLRAHWNLDKARSLLYLCQYIKSGWVKFFQYDAVDGGKSSLVTDFLSLVEDKHNSLFGSDVYTIIRDTATHKPDDFTASCNYAANWLWGGPGRRYPQLRVVGAIQPQELSDELIRKVEGDFQENESNE
jgi:hypothetical protein